MIETELPSMTELSIMFHKQHLLVNSWDEVIVSSPHHQRRIWLVWKLYNGKYNIQKVTELKLKFHLSDEQWDLDNMTMIFGARINYVDIHIPSLDKPYNGRAVSDPNNKIGAIMTEWFTRPFKKIKFHNVKEYV